MLKNIRDLDLGPPHPGEILRDDMLPRLQLEAKGLAGKLNLSLETIADLLGERLPITREIAARLSAVFGHSVQFWLGLQLQYDQWIARGNPQAI